MAKRAEQQTLRDIVRRATVEARVRLKGTRENWEPDRITQEDLATRAKLPRTTIVRVEGANGADIKLSTVDALASAAGLTQIEFLQLGLQPKETT